MALEVLANSRLVAIVGPTAVGKSELALRLAQQMSAEIVNADSRQVYRHMDIGTGKPTLEERALIPHHVFDVVDPDEAFSLGTYSQFAKIAIDDVRRRGHLPLLVGGTGQYVWSVVEGWKVPEVPPDSAFRLQMETRARSEGHEALHAELERVDPEAAAHIQATNVRRIIRALELHRATGELPSSLLWSKKGLSESTLVLGVGMERRKLFARADARVDRMVLLGFAAEVRALMDGGYEPFLPSMSSIGYREMYAHVRGECDLATAVEKTKVETHRLIRRQHTWFRPSDDRIAWIDGTESGRAFQEAMHAIQGAMV